MAGDQAVAGGEVYCWGMGLPDRCCTQTLNVKRLLVMYDIVEGT